MNALSSSTLKIDDLDDELQFTLTRDVGWLEVVIPVSAACGVGIWGAYTGSMVGLFVCAVAIGGMLINWALGPTTVFRISGNRLVASGNLRRWSSSDIDIPANEVKSIGWSSGGRNSSSGLYAWHGLRGTCVLPGLPKKKAAEVTDAISKKYPQFRIGSGSVWSFGLDTGL
jgi:hypothetical protein